MMAIIRSLKCTVPFPFAVPLFSLTVTHCHSLLLFVSHFHSLSLVVPLVLTRCHSLSFVVTRCTTRCHSLSFVVTRCTTRCHSLLLVVPLIVTRCHSLSLVVPLVVTRCTTRLSFYKRSNHEMFILNGFRISFTNHAFYYSYSGLVVY